MSYQPVTDSVGALAPKQILEEGEGLAQHAGVGITEGKTVVSLPQPERAQKLDARVADPLGLTADKVRPGQHRPQREDAAGVDHVPWPRGGHLHRERADLLRALSGERPLDKTEIAGAEHAHCAPEPGLAAQPLDRCQPILPIGLKRPPLATRTESAATALHHHLIATRPKDLPVQSRVLPPAP